MTTSSTTDAQHAAEFADRFAPKLVNLNFHGSNITFTVLIGDKYYTAERVYPDFIDVANDAKLVLADHSLDTQLRQQYRAASTSYPTRKSVCESNMITALLSERELTFGDYFQRHLVELRLDDVEPTNYSYYEAKKVFVAVWHRLAALIEV